MSNRICVKVGYDTRAEARRAARLTSLDYGKLNAYRCPKCDLYHIGHRHPQAEVDHLNARVVVRGADGITTVLRGEVGEVTIDPCPVCGLKRIYQQTQPDSDGMSTASWECPDGHLSQSFSQHR